MLPDAFSIIDSKIKQHENEIIALKTQRNACAPISRLPPELFTQIFEWYKKVESQHHIPLTWIQCSHVCHLWRTIALNSSTSWADLDLKYNYLTWAKEALVRSKMAVLKVSIHLNGTHDERSTIQLAKNIMCQGPRLKGLTIGGAFSARNGLEEILRSLPKSTPNLQSLEIAHVQTGIENIYLPSECISEAEKLQHVKITGCGINWVQHISNKSTLTVLKLTDVTSTRDVSMPQFLQCLAGMPSIQILELKNAFPTLVPHHSGAQSQRVPLPKLQELRLSECPANILGFIFKHVFLNAGVFMDIHSQGTDESFFTIFFEELEMSSAMSLNQAHLAIHTLKIATAKSRQLSMAGFSHHNPELDRETIGLSRERDISPMFVLKLTIFSASSSQRDALWINACAILPFTWVRTVYWSCLPAISAETINSCFGTLQNLNCMLFRCTYPDFYKMLRATLPSPEGTCPKSVFPELRMITLNDFVLYGEHLSNLIDLLIQRYEAGSEVQRLVLLNCLGVDDEEIDLLREVVVDVFWDGTVRKLDGNQVDMDDYYYYNWFY